LTQTGIATALEASHPPDPITVVVTDDHVVVREGLRLLIDSEPQMRVVAEADDVASARLQMREHQPTVLVLDVNLGGESGLDAIPLLRKEAPGTAILVLTMEKEAAYASQAFDAGAAGYVIKDAAAKELVRAIRAIAAGETYVHPEIGGRLLQAKLRPPEEPLTDRERQVLGLIAMGHTNAQVSEQLYLSVRTVESHRARMYEKLGVRSRAELIRYALDHGLVER
jgi:two-component system response regulator NreC